MRSATDYSLLCCFATKIHVPLPDAGSRFTVGCRDRLRNSSRNTSGCDTVDRKHVYYWPRVKEYASAAQREYIPDSESVRVLTAKECPLVAINIGTEAGTGTDV